MKSRRFLALSFPRLPTDRIRQHEPLMGGRPLATWTLQGSRRVLVSVDAPATRLHARQALADAQAWYPDLLLRPSDGPADLAFLKRLALWSVQFTPLVGLAPPDGLVLDVTGCTALFGGEAALLARISRTLATGGLTVHAVVASLAEVAIALARTGQPDRIVARGAEAAAITPLPLTVLRLPVDVTAGLHRLGLQHVGDVLRQPRAPFMRRFGRPLLDAWDALTGDRPRVLSPVRAPPEFLESVTCLEPIITRAGIDGTLDHLLERLCCTLRLACCGARQVTLRAFRVDRDVQEVTIGTGLPTRTPAHLRRLFTDRLERLEPDLGFERMTLQADVTNPWEGTQEAIATAGLPQGAQQEALAQLIDRLSQRLPVWRLASYPSHWPERSVIRVSPFATEAGSHLGTDRPAPVRLLRRPLPVRVRIVEPDSLPLCLQIGHVVHPITWAEGPERIEPEWWRDPLAQPARDYFRVEVASGSRLWIGRSHVCGSDKPARWFLHGYLP